MKRIAIYNYYNENGFVLDSTFELLRQLKDVSDEIIIVVNGHLNRPEVFNEFTDNVLMRENCGYDAAAYAEVFSNEKYKYLMNCCDELIFCNCSFWGPFVPLKDIFSHMESKKCDFWGMSSSNRNLVNHLQSYFVVYRSFIMKEKEVQTYFANYIKTSEMTYEEVCNIFENGLCSYLLGRGYRYSSYVQNLRCDNYTNPYGCLYIDKLPIIKKKALSNDYFDEDQIAASLQFVEQNYNYDVSKIVAEAQILYGRDVQELLYRKPQLKLRTQNNQNALLISDVEVKNFIERNEKIYILGTGNDALHVFNTFFFLYKNPKFAGFIVEEDTPANIDMKDTLRLAEIERGAAILVCVDYSKVDELNERLKEYSNVLNIWKSEKERYDLTVNFKETIITAYGKYYYYNQTTLYVVDDDRRCMGIIGKDEIEKYYSFSEDTSVLAIYNPDFKYLLITEDYEKLSAILFEQYSISSLPLLDEERKIVSIIFRD